MTNLFDAQLDLPANSYPPDPWDGGSGVALRLDSVISKDGDGQPLSYVGDFVWNWMFYTQRKEPSNLSFYFWRTQGSRVISEDEITVQRLALMRELQYLMVHRIYHSDRLLGYLALASYLFSLGKIARFAHDRGCPMRDVLTQTALLDAYIATVPSSQCKDVVRLINFLRSLDPRSELGFEVAKAKKWRELIRRAQRQKENYFQTAPLPTRVYLGLINALASEFDEIEAHRGRMLTALREALRLHARFKAGGNQGTARFGPDLIAKHGLGDFLIRKGHSADLHGLTMAVTNIMRICKTQINTFSGMRDEEAGHLPFHCMETVRAEHGRTHSLIVGVTTKLAGAQRLRTRWVTTDAQGFRAIRLAQSFANVIYKFIGVKPSTGDKLKDNFPLFVSSSYFPWIGYLDNHSASRYLPGRALRIRYLSDQLKAALCPTIEADDIAELEAIDPFRDWNSEPEFAIGQPWPLKSHQLRRSLALYANASGLVRISSLRRQLQHLTREMVEYYGRGSVFAKNFLKDDPKGYKEHICREWQDTEQEAQYLAFTRDVLNSDEPLCGSGGLFYELKKQRGEVMSAQEVRDQLKMGRMAYKSHHLGGCTNVGICDKQKGLRLIGGICISEHCKSLVGKHSSILKLIPIQRAILSHMDPDSIAGQMEKEELEILEATEVQWRTSKRPLCAIPGGVHV